jgi:hypothetical protein
MMVMIDICGSLYLGKKNSSNADMKELKWEATSENGEA